MTDPNDALVYLSSGPLSHGNDEYYDGELVPRSHVPDYAVRGGGNVQVCAQNGGVDGRWYEEWVIEG